MTKKLTANKLSEKISQSLISLKIKFEKKVSSKKFEILRIGSEASSETMCSNSADTDIRSELVTKYPKVFTGSGKFTGYMIT